MNYSIISLKIKSLFVLWFSTCILARNPQKDLQTLEEKVRELAAISAKRPLIKLNEKDFRRFVQAGPRNYSFIIMFTALSASHQCAMCRQARDEFQIVANSMRYNKVDSSSLFFAVVDFDASPNIFRSMRVDAVPTFLHFPAKGKLKKADTMDIQRIGFQAEIISKWITERTNIQIKVYRPPTNSTTLALALLFILMVVLIYMKSDNLDFIFNKTFWGLVTLGIVFYMTSGQMWNHIRGPPLMHHSPEGTEYIHGNSGFQFIAETYIVMILNAAITLGFILMQEAVLPKDLSTAMLPNIMAIVGLVLVFLFFSVLLSIFRMKLPGYPFRAFFLF